MTLSTHVERIKGIVFVRLDGRLDATSSVGLESRLIELLQKGESKIALDCTNVSYLSSAGMRLLLSMTKKCTAQKGFFALFGVQEDVLEIIKMAGFEKILKIFSSQEEVFG